MMNVLFYDKYRKAHSYHLPKAFDEGSNGTIHRIDKETCLKWFNDDNQDTQTIIEMIMNLELNNFYKIYNLLYDESNTFCGYTMKYYENEEFDILTMPMEYTITNLMDLAKSLNILSENKICTVDLFDGNIIKTKKGITVIDVDAYKYLPKAENGMIYNYNNESLYYLLGEIFLKALKTYHNSEYLDKINIKEIFDMQLSPDETCKKLVKYKYPIDYIRSKR